MSKILSLGIIGFGGMGSYHSKELSSYDRLSVKGVYDLNSERRDYAEEIGLKAYSSKEELLKDEEIDAVLIATTNEVHKELCIEAIKASKHVICEKPVTLTSEELVEIIDVANKYNKIFTVNQNRRTNRDFVLMRNNVETGVIGKPYIIESRVEGSRGMPSGWRTIKELGGGMMLDWGVHLIDQIMYMFPEKVVSVYSRMYNIQYSEVEDNFSLTIVFESGLTSLIEVYTNNYIKHPRWYVLGKKGTLVIHDWDCQGTIIRSLDNDDQWEEEIVFSKAGPSKTMAPRSEHTVETIKISEPEDVVDDLTVVYDQFIDAIEGKAELIIKPEQALRVMKVMEAAFESAKKNEVIKVDI